MLSSKKVIVSLCTLQVNSALKPAQAIAAPLWAFMLFPETALALKGSAQSPTAKPNESISSACPVVVDLITRYLPHFTPSITALLSPMLSHCKLLRKRYGNDTGIVFIGPCIAKKREADSHPNLIDAAITFSDLRKWLEKKNIDPASITPNETDHFVPGNAEEGALYPVDGGMAATIKTNCSVHDSCFMSFSGLKNIINALDGLQMDLENNIYSSCCEGGW